MTDNIDNPAEIASFAPIIDAECKILILGTMPGAESLRKQECYGYKMNQFWNMIYTLFEQELTDNYDKRISLLLQKHIAVWDVLKSCKREGSSDSNIKNPIVNDFDQLFNKYPNIKNIYFNGKNAEKLFEKHAKYNSNKDYLLFHMLPSTSPANNTVTFLYKLEKWKAILISLS